MDLSNVSITWDRVEGKRKVIVRCTIEGRVAHTDELNIEHASQRSSFTKQLVKLGIDQAYVHNRLLEIIAEVANYQANQKSNVDDSTTELDVQTVVRPELIIDEGVTGISVPIRRMTAKGTVQTDWQLYVNDNGSRLRMPIDPTLKLRSKSLTLSPIPFPPSADEITRWSKGSREIWLASDHTVDPQKLYYDLARAIDRYIDFPADRRNATLGLLVCWVILTYVYQAWDRVGYLLVQGPTGSGKSTLMRVLRELVFRPLSTENISAPALYRTLHARGGTLLYDEAERLRDTRSPEIQDINGMLLAGHERNGGAIRVEKQGDAYVALQFQVYGPKAIAGINGVSPALSGRSVIIRTERATKGSKKPKRRIRDRDWASLRDDIHCLVLDGHNWPEFAAKRDVGADLNARDFDVWQPILAIASFFELSGVKGLTRMLNRFAERLIEENSEQNTPEPDLILLQTLTEFVLAGERPTAQEILNRLQVMWKMIFERVTAGAIGTRLRAYGISSQKSNTRREFRVTREQLMDIQFRYSIDLGLA